MQQQRTNNNWGKKNGQVMHCMQTAHADSTLYLGYIVNFLFSFKQTSLISW